MVLRKEMAEIKKGFKYPSLILYELIHILEESTTSKIYNWQFDRKYSNRIDVMAEDWDNLILLDACRYDYFAEQIKLDGKLRKVVSKGGASWPFMECNFVGRELHDTVYVTANLHVEKLDPNIFYTVETVPASERNPEKVVEAAKYAYDAYPNKRLLVHFMQPHRPYLGPTADTLREEVNEIHLRKTASVTESGDQHVKPKLAYSMFKTGEYPLEFLHQMYEENLALVLERTYELLGFLNGKTVISADHGELLGERKGLFRQRKFGHPETLKTVEGFTVPWFEIEGKNRREIVAEEPIGFERLEDEVVHQRLRELGYVDREI